MKCMRSMRRWAFEVFRNERAIRFVAMVTKEDLNANAGVTKYFVVFSTRWSFSFWDVHVEVYC